MFEPIAPGEVRITGRRQHRQQVAAATADIEQAYGPARPQPFEGGKNEGVEDGL